jgi:hypothetical protein
MTTVVKGTKNAIRFQMVTEQDIEALTAKIEENSNLGDFTARNVNNTGPATTAIELSF